MSYILDALKRAESERSRGAVPTIHAAPTAALPMARGAGGRWVAAGAAILVIAVAGASLWWLWPAAPSVPAAPLAATMPAPAPVPVPASVPVPISPPVAPPAPAVQAQAVPGPASPAPAAESSSAARSKATVRKPAEAVATPRASPPRVAQEKSKPTPPTGSTARSARPVEADAPAGVERPPTPGPQAPAPVDLSEERIYSVRELPDAIRSSLPALTVAGATYSENPASRMLIVNGRLAHEGDAVAPEVTLQQIKLRTAVLSFRGYRYFINY